MVWRPQIATRIATLCPDATLFRSGDRPGGDLAVGARSARHHRRSERADPHPVALRGPGLLRGRPRAPEGRARPQGRGGRRTAGGAGPGASARAARSRSEEHTSELQSLMRISYAVFCLKKKKTHKNNTNTR